MNGRHVTTGLFFILALLLVAEPATAQRDNSRVRPSPNAKVSQTIGTTEIDMHYSRPGVKGRTIFGGLQAWGDVWRAGANEPTTITFSGDVLIEGEALAAGTYALWMVPMEEGNWDVVFGTMVRWGTMSSQSDEVLRVSVTRQEGDQQEWLMYTFKELTDTSATLIMHWATTIVPIHITLPG
ncbi:MAG: DUF2911 domain-containing protein [Rhodothermales bacterium]